MPSCDVTYTYTGGVGTIPNPVVGLTLNLSNGLGGQWTGVVLSQTGNKTSGTLVIRHSEYFATTVEPSLLAGTANKWSTSSGSWVVNISGWSWTNVAECEAPIATTTTTTTTTTVVGSFQTVPNETAGASLVSLLLITSGVWALVGMVWVRGRRA